MITRLQLGRLRIGVALAVFLACGAARAQDTPPATTPPAIGGTPAPGTAPTTPPNGIARGVVRPHRRVDPSMVKRPPPHGRPSMPVIRPPGVAR